MSDILYQGANSDFPQLSSAVRVGRDQKRGRFLEAVVDIPPGALVCVDCAKTVTFNVSRCHYCVAPLVSKSRTVCPKCEKSPVSRWISLCESYFQESLRNLGLTELAVRVVLSYPVGQVLEYVLADSSSEITGLSSDHFSSVASLETSTELAVDRQALAPVLDKLVVHLQNTKTAWPQVPNLRVTFEKAVLFVLCRLPTNAHNIFEPSDIPQVAEMLPAGKKRTAWILHEQVEDALYEENDKVERMEHNDGPLAVGLFPIASIMNHSCKPNTYSYFDCNQMIFRSRGILKGEEVTDCYGMSIYTHDASSRQTSTQMRGFDCHCTSCVKGVDLYPILYGTKMDPQVFEVCSLSHPLFIEQKCPEAVFTTHREPLSRLTGALNLVCSRTWLANTSSDLFSRFNIHMQYKDTILTEYDQLDSSLEQLMTKFHRMKELYVDGNLQLERMAHFLAVEFVRAGKLQAALDCLTLLFNCVKVKGLPTLSLETAAIAHSEMLIRIRIWESTGDHLSKTTAQKSFFTALCAYRTFYGLEGSLTLKLMRDAEAILD